ncbi:MAG: GWxTD domain-containing protein [Ignavibacteriaceae bacterium]
MKNLYLFLFIIFTAVNLFAQDEITKNAELKPSKFNYEYLDFRSDQAVKTRVDVFLQVPYNEIQFIKKGDDFEANYTATVSIFDKEREKLIAEKIWNEKVATKDFSQTTSSRNFNLSLRSFELPPGEYTFRSAFEDKDSRQTHSKEDVIKVRDVSADFAISDIMIVEKKTIVNGENKILPNIKKQVSARQGGLLIFYEIYSDTNSVFQIEYNISNKNDVFVSEKTMKQLKKGTNQIFYTVPDSTISMGDYEISVTLRDIGDHDLATAKQPFVSRWLGFPSTAKDIDEAIEQLVYIASPSEIDFINDGKTKDEKIERFREFWKKKDPVPSTEENEVFNEYFRRVSIANANFSHYVKGWKTDRGMVLIILGNPDNIERHPFEVDSKPYQVWDYYQLNQSFVFVDETGFGDYRLVTPLTGDLYRYRYRY